MLLGGAVLAATLLCGCVAAQQYHYTVMEGMDAPYKDIENGNTTNVAELEALCNELAGAPVGARGAGGGAARTRGKGEMLNGMWSGCQRAKDSTRMAG